MADAARMLKANLKLSGKPCGWCQTPLALGDDAAVCEACQKEHHARCWEQRAGCAGEGCANAPLKQLDARAAGGEALAAGGAAGSAPLLAGMMLCPRCRSPLPVGTLLCGACNCITSPDGLYHGPQVNAPGAVASLVWGILGLLICGVIFGAVAISKSKQAKAAIASHPQYTGGGLATAGLVLGIIDIVAWAIILIARFSSMGNQ